MPIPYIGIMPQRFEWGMTAATLRSPSLANGSEQVIARAGSRWTAMLGWDAMNPDNTRWMRAWLARLRGGAETALLGPMMQRAPYGSMRGAPVVSGANHVGVTIQIKDAQPGRTFVAGDYVQIADQIHLVVFDVMADTNGVATLTVEPPRRKAPPDGALVQWHNPVIPMRLTSERWAQKFGPPLLPGWSAGLELEFVESWL